MKHALYCATKALLTVLLVLWWPWCSPRPVCLAGESSPVSIIFTRQGDNPPSTSIAQAGSIFDITGATWRSKYPVAPPGTYVALCQGGAGVAGAWADPQGFVGLMVPCPATGSCSLSYSSKQSMSIARSSIHRLSGQNGEAQPAAARSDYFLFLAYEGLGGSGEMRSWNLETGTERGRYIWNHPSGPIFRPWVVPYQSGSTYYIFHDVKTAAGYRLVTRVSATHSFVYADVVRTAPHNPVAYTIGGLIHAYYTRPYTTATAVGKETYVAEGCRPMSGNSCLMKGPPNLSNLTLACTPTGHMLLAGEEDGQVYVYGGSLMRRSVTGQRPALAYVSVSGRDYILSAYLVARGENTLVQGELLDGTGFVKGPATTLFTIPQSQVDRISLVQAPTGDCWLFWQGTCQGRNQIFVTKVALPW